MRVTKFFEKSAIFLLSIVLCGWALFPLYWAFITSLKTGIALFLPELLPHHPTFENYLGVFTEQPFWKNILNSITVAAWTVLVAGFLAVLAAYPLSRRRFRGRGMILLVFLFVSMFPQIAILSGLFALVNWLGLFNRKSVLVISYLVFTLPFTVWTLSVFMRDLPRGVEEAALMDGAGTGTILFRILLPMMVPSLVTTSLFGFIGAWNEFLFALTFTMTDKARTVPVAIAMMSGASEYEIPWGRIMAASVLVTLPIIALVLIFQRRIVSGLTAGAVKG
jgi:trehalose/maltose transport system permease protein